MKGYEDFIRSWEKFLPAEKVTDAGAATRIAEKIHCEFRGRYPASQWERDKIDYTSKIILGSSLLTASKRDRYKAYQKMNENR